MAYISKELILKSYLALSALTDDHKQGQTQIVSAIRHFFALDMFYKQENRDCDLKKSEDREKFTENVKKLVNVKGIDYTTNFYTNIKPLEDCGVGSNFTSAGVIKNSKENTTYLYEYPTRGQNPLFNARNAVAIRNITFYKNIRHYLGTDILRTAFILWTLREDFVSDLSNQGIRRKLEQLFTPDAVKFLMPKEECLINFVEDFPLSESKSVIEVSDLHALFMNNTKASSTGNTKYRPYITAIKSKPFLLLAGISGTGKSRIVRELARACWDVDSKDYEAQKPQNFEMVQVKPNWHDSSELIGYVSRVSGKAEFIAGDFLKFVARAWEDPDIPYFLCLDEMNLAPVEQYFAEYLSVLESRKAHKGGVITTDPILKKAEEEWYFSLTASLTSDESIRNQFNRDGICLPQNLIVVGTVNMDETTFSFSRKVLDRAMTIEMNEVNLYGGLTERNEPIGKLSYEDLIGTAVEGVDVYSPHKEVCNVALEYLEKVNSVLEGTPFKIAYRTRNEFLLYVVNNLPYSKGPNASSLPQGYIIARALDEITSMKILSRIEGDDSKVSDNFLESLTDTIEQGLQSITDDEHPVESISIAKLKEMRGRLTSGYTSFWS